MSGHQEIFCPNREMGCQEVCSNQKDFDIHLQSCGYNHMPCPQECSVRVLKRNLINHLQSECPRRLVMCIYCKREMCDENLKEHQAECDYKRVKCEYCDLFGIQKKELKAHYEECEKRPRDCNLKAFGCIFSGPKTEYEEHIADIPSHFPLLVNTISNLRTELTSKMGQIQKLTQEGGAIKRKLLTLENTQQSQASEIKELKIKLSELREENTKLKKKGPPSARTHTKNKNKEPLDLPLSSRSSDTSLDSRDITLDNMEPVVCQRKVLVGQDNRWTINRYDKLRNSPLIVVWSDMIYVTHHQGYNFNLSMCIPPRDTKKNIHVGLFISLQKGENDASLTWPFPYTIIMGFVNQRTHEEMEACRFNVNTVSEEFKSHFNRPLSIRNRKVGHPSVMPLRDLENPTKGFLVNDQIIIYVRLIK